MGQILFEYGYGNLEYNRGPTHTTKISVLDKFKNYICISTAASI